MVSSKPTFRERLNFAFDKTLSRGPRALIGWLAPVMARLPALLFCVIVCNPAIRGSV